MTTTTAALDSALPPGAQHPTDPADLLFVRDAGERRGEMLYRKLGHTGEVVSAIGLGGFHVGKNTLSDADAVRLIHQAIDRGITFLDNSWDYNKGRSEERMGAALAQGGYRDRVFLMTKIDGRTRQEATRQIEQSLRRLRTDHLDLVQHHEILRYDDPDRIFEDGGAMEACVDAKQAGKLRYVGFTGHKHPQVHLQMLDVAAARGFRFDTVQMPLNVMDAHFRSFAHGVLPYLVQHDIGVLGMKSFADSVLLKSGVPIEPVEFLHYSLNLPTSVVITGIESQDNLDQAFRAVASFRPMDRAAVAELLSRSRPAALEGKYELFKTSSIFDSTATNGDWLGEASPQVKARAPVME